MFTILSILSAAGGEAPSLIFKMLVLLVAAFFMGWVSRLVVDHFRVSNSVKK